MVQVIDQTDQEKLAMYMKMPKKKIAEMLIQCNKILDAELNTGPVVSDLCLTNNQSVDYCKYCGKAPCERNGMSFPFEEDDLC